MAVNASIAVTSVTWNGNTWNNSSGGSLKVDYSHSSQPVENRSGDDDYPTIIFPTNKTATVTVTLREFFLDLGDSIECGTVSNLVVTLRTCGDTASFTCSNMMLTDISGSQDKDSLGESTLTFVHVSTDGATNPTS